MKTKEFAQNIIAIHRKHTTLWHVQSSEFLLPEDITAQQMVIQQHNYNFDLWHEEDKAREPGVSDSTIASVKRNIDRLNQQRNDAITKIDEILACTALARFANKNKPWNSETIGSIVDRLSIADLKIYHMLEQTQRQNIDQDHIDSCAIKHQALQEQRNNLATALQQFIDDIVSGNKQNKLYHQFKMYNDPSLNPKIYTHSQA